MSNSDSSQTLRERTEESNLKLWILLRMNRWTLTGIILIGMFFGIAILSFLELSPIQTVVAATGAIQILFGPFMGGAIITGVTLVVTLNQLVLSQELGAIGDQRERMQEAMKFRRDVESASHVDLAPPEPSAFLRHLIAAIQDRIETLYDRISEEADNELQNEIEDYVETLNEDAEMVRDNIKGAQFGTFDVIWRVLDFNYSRKIFRARQIQNEYGEDLSDEANETIDELIETLSLFGPAREHFKTLYFQWELINLSRSVSYAAVPALLAAVGMIIYTDATAVGGTFLGIANLVWLVSFAFVITLSPFIILLSFIFRIATVAQRTLAMGPFILREMDSEQATEYNEQ
ncbi:hypothetical protein [Halalkalicoccus salilacus]|uniref:hypothetical protein n=1 Tax=Halalkalicoccus salilacus TaxID=3117459 RepID=UPI00300EF40C